MSDSTTSNYHFTLPAIGASQDSWGNKLNSNFTALDSLIHSLVVEAGGSGSASLPITGGTINGNLAVTGNSSVGGNLGVSGAITTGGLAVSGNIGAGQVYFASPAVTDFTAYRSAPNRVFQWAGGVTDAYNDAIGVRYWNANGALMNLDNGGNLTIVGAGIKPGGGLWQAASDDRVKRNARPYTSGLAEIMRLEPITFEYNGQGGTKADGVTYHGLSAQSTRSIMPELVLEERHPRKDGTRDPALLPGQLATQLGPLILALVNAVKELTVRVAVLEARCPA
jgi:hypothetical protein